MLALLGTARVASNLPCKDATRVQYASPLALNNYMDPAEHSTIRHPSEVLCASSPHGRETIEKQPCKSGGLACFSTKLSELHHVYMHHGDHKKPEVDPPVARTEASSQPRGRGSLDTTHIKALRTNSSMKTLQPDRLAPSDGCQKFHVLDHQALYRDRIFSEMDWSYHMSGWRYMVEPKILLKVCIALLVPLSVVTVISIICAIYEGTRPADYPTLSQLELFFPYSLIGFALALLLVFKTNTSYARFWEGAHHSSPCTYSFSVLLVAQSDRIADQYSACC